MGMGHVICADLSGWGRAEDWISAEAGPVFLWHFRPAPEAARIEAVRPRCVRRVGQLRAAFAEWLISMDPVPAGLIFHDGSGAELLNLADYGGHRIHFHARHLPYWHRIVRNGLGVTGKLLVGNQIGVERVRAEMPWIPERHIAEISSPMRVDPFPKIDGEKRWRLGVVTAGRRNRLRQLSDRFEFNDAELDPVEFGGVELINRNWSAVLLMDDYALDEGWLAKLISEGVFPIVPHGENGSPIWVEPGAPRRYDWGDFSDACSLFREWRDAAESASVHANFKAWAGKFTAPCQTVQWRQQWNRVQGHFFNERIPKVRNGRESWGMTPLWWWFRLQRLRGGF